MFGGAGSADRAERGEKEKAVRGLTAFREKYRLEGLLLLFLFRIALLASFLVLGGFDAAFVAAFFAGFLGVIAATGLDICRADNERESANK